MKLSDLFEDYCKVGEIQIVKIFGLDVFLAIMTAEKRGEKLIMARHMNKTLMKKLKDNELTDDELLGEIYQWLPLQRIEKSFGEKHINEIIEHAESQGHVVKKDVESREQGTGKNTKSKWLGLKKRKK